MKRKSKYLFILLIIVCTLPQSVFSQIQALNFEQLDSLQKTEKKPVIVFLHTSWCKYCGTLKNTTFKNKEIAKLLHQEFYFVSLDIEEKNDIFFHGHTFKYKPTGVNTGVHELAEQLGTIEGEIGYPALCFLNADYEILYQRKGYVSAGELLSILKKLK